jgi:hypothetical protein
VVLRDLADGTQREVVLDAVPAETGSLAGQSVD